MFLGLIGYRGSGKTTLGRLLAKELSTQFTDTDEEIVHQAGKTIREIFEQDGEKAFRDFESQIVSKVGKLKNVVVAFGGGAMDREENRTALRFANPQLVYLRCDPLELYQRIQTDKKTAEMRPNLTHLGGSVSEIELVLSRREPIWRSISTAEIDVSTLKAEDVVQKIIALLP